MPLLLVLTFAFQSSPSHTPTGPPSPEKKKKGERGAMAVLEDVLGHILNLSTGTPENLDVSAWAYV
jgi:hypothetical protein